MKRVLVVGMAVIDFVFEVDTMPDRAEKYIASEASVVGGGGAANAAVAIANLGGTAMLAGRIGRDTIGDLILADLQARNVDCSLLQRTADARSSYSSVLIDAAGERLIVNYRGGGLLDDATAISQLQQTKSQRPAAVLADTRWHNGVVAAMQLASALGVPGILDAEPPLDPELLKLASHIAFSREGLVSLTSDNDLPRSLLQVQSRYNSWLCVTDGANGVYHLANGEVQHVPAPEVSVVDTLGAGDVWHGAFAYALAEQPPPTSQSLSAAIQFANAAAAITCSRAGGGRVSPTRAEVDAFIAGTGTTN